MDRWKSRGGKRRRAEERRSEKRKSEKKDDAGARKGRKVAKHCVFPMICGSGESLKRRVRSHLARWEMKSCTPLWREAHFEVVEVKKLKTPHVWSTFGSWAVEKVHAVAAQSTFRSQKCEKLAVSETFGSWDVEKMHAIVAQSTFRSQKC